MTWVPIPPSVRWADDGRAVELLDQDSSTQILDENKYQSDQGEMEWV